MYDVDVKIGMKVVLYGKIASRSKEWKKAIEKNQPYLRVSFSINNETNVYLLTSEDLDPVTVDLIKGGEWFYASDFEPYIENSVLRRCRYLHTVHVCKFTGIYHCKYCETTNYTDEAPINEEKEKSRCAQCTSLIHKDENGSYICKHCGYFTIYPNQKVEEKSMTINNSYYVYEPSTGYTKQQHPTIESAKKEAERLASLNPEKEYQILVPVASCKKSEINWEYSKNFDRLA